MYHFDDMQEIIDKLPDWTLRLFWPAAWPYFILHEDSILIGIVLTSYVVFRTIKWFKRIDEKKETASERFERIRKRIEIEESKKKETLDWIWLFLFLAFAGMVALTYFQLRERISTPFSLEALVYTSTIVGFVVVGWDIKKDLKRMNESKKNEEHIQSSHTTPASAPR